MTEYSLDLYIETVYLAIFIMLYTLFSGLAALFTHILFRMNGQQVAYVSLLCISIFLQQIATLTQQTIAVVRWNPLQVELYEDNLKKWRDPNASTVYMTNPNIVLRCIFAIRVYFFNVESLLFFFWSFTLFCSLWEIKYLWIRNPKTTKISKYVAYIVPGIQAIVSNVPAIVEFEPFHLIIANVIMTTTVSLGFIFLALILVKFIIVSLNSKGKPFKIRDDRRRAKATSDDLKGSSQMNHEDRWIILRFTVGFFVIGGLQTSFLYSQYAYSQSAYKLRDPNALKPVLGWSREEQLADWAYYVSGSSTGYLILLVFGTTHESRVQVRRIWNSLWGSKKQGGSPGRESPVFLMETKRDPNNSYISREVSRESGPTEKLGQSLTPSVASQHQMYDVEAHKVPASTAQSTPVAQFQSTNTDNSDEVPPFTRRFRASSYRSFGTGYDEEYHHQNVNKLATLPTPARYEQPTPTPMTPDTPGFMPIQRPESTAMGWMQPRRI